MTHRLPSPLLVVEASTSAGSVALIVDDAVVAERAVTIGPSREDALLPAIAEVMSEARMEPREIRGVACGSGPGSFTSLRIAASLAKGLVVANEATLYAIPSLLLAAAPLSAVPGRYVLHADALRNERYVVRVIVSADGALDMSHVMRMALDDVAAMATAEHATVISVGASAHVISGSTMLAPHARNAALLGALWPTFGPVSVEQWEPDYGRLAEAQVKWESTHGRALPTS